MCEGVLQFETASHEGIYNQKSGDKPMARALSPLMDNIWARKLNWIKSDDDLVMTIDEIKET